MLIYIFVLLLGLLAGCTPDNEPGASDPTAVPTATEGVEQPGGEVITNEAMVESVQVLIMESLPVQVAVEIGGNLPDGCTTIDGIEATREGSTFTINITTQRDPLALCTQALVPFTERVTLDVLGLEAGTYTVNVVGRDSTVSETFELAVDNVPVEEPAEEPTTAPTAIELPASCFPTSEENGPFINLQDGYCLQYPVTQGFHVKDVLPGGIASIWGPPLTPSFEPIRAGLTIVKESPADGRSLDEIIILVLIENPDAQIADAAATFAGEPAQVIEGIPGMMDSRRIYLIHNDFLYIVTLVPLTDQSEFAEDVMAQRELLWQTVSESFTWLPPAVVEQFSPCPAIEEGASPFLNVQAGYCLQYPSHYQQQHLISQNLGLLTSGVLDPTIPEPVRVTMKIETSPANGRSVEQVVTDVAANYEGLTIGQSGAVLGGVTAVILTGLPGLDASRDLYAVHNDTVYHLRIDPLEIPEWAEDLEETWARILATFTFMK
jgi:hypothetical protein